MRNMGSFWKILTLVVSFFVFQSASADATFDARTEQNVNWANAGYPPDFAALCQGDLTPRLQEQFDANLAKAEQALRAGKLDEAYDALGRVDSAGMRGPNETFFSAGIKCQGEAVARRRFVAWRDYYLARKAQGRKDIPLWVIAADGGKNSLLMYTQNYDGDNYRRAVMEVRTLVERKEQERDYGAFLLSEETAILQACNSALPEMKVHADGKHKAALAAEDRGFNHTPTAQEQAMIENTAGLGAMMGAGSMDSELMVMGQRVSLSQEALHDARDWNFILFNDSGYADENDAWQELPSSQRARKRGDTLMAKANDSSLSYASRDDYYDMAIDYYSFGHWKQQRDNAMSSKGRIQDNVMAERQQAEARMEQMQADMEVRLESAQEGMEAMKKTEAEKKSFNDEADALEAELGF